MHKYLLSKARHLVILLIAATLTLAISSVTAHASGVGGVWAGGSSSPGLAGTGEISPTTFGLLKIHVFLADRSDVRSGVETGTWNLPNTTSGLFLLHPATDGYSVFNQTLRSVAWPDQGDLVHGIIPDNRFVVGGNSGNPLKDATYNLFLGAMTGARYPGGVVPPVGGGGTSMPTGITAADLGIQQSDFDILVADLAGATLILPAGNAEIFDCQQQQARRVLAALIVAAAHRQAADGGLEIIMIPAVEWNAGPGPWAISQVVTGTYWREHTFTVRFMFLESAGYTSAQVAQIRNDVLLAMPQFQINPSTMLPAFHGFDSLPGDGSQPGPGVGTGTYLLGATNAWIPVFTAGPFEWSDEADCCWDPAGGPRWESEAVAEWQAAVGEIFAQNDALWIEIGSTRYTFVSPNLVTATLQPGAHTDLWAVSSADDFRPRGEQWHSLEHVPVSGFTGHNLTSAARNAWARGPNSAFSAGTGFWVAEDLQIVERLVNGVYSFQPWEQDNYMTYAPLTVIKGSPQGLLATTAWEGMTHSPVEVVEPGRNVVGSDRVLLQYTSWQPQWDGMLPPNPGLTGNNTGNPPTYSSINPVIIHNPTGNLFAWVHDVPEQILADQRIRLLGSEGAAGQRGDIIRHDAALYDAFPARLYIDFDFRVSIPNHATLRDYSYPMTPSTLWGWGTGSAASVDNSSPPAEWGLAGIVDIADTPPGWRGKGYDGDRQDRWTFRDANNPHSPAWDVSKWINAKFIQFTFDVYFYGTVIPSTIPNMSTHHWGGNAHPGGDHAGFYPAGTWILLYDNNWQVAPGGVNPPYSDPVNFYFRVPSHVLDTDLGVVNFITENINARDLVAGFGGDVQARANFHWANSEVGNNGQRNRDWHMPLGGDPVGLSLAAEHAVTMQQQVHIVGRIGNVVIDDLADPRWTNIFWNVDGAGNPLTHMDPSIAPNRFVTSHFNMFDTLQHRFNWSLPRHPWHNNNSFPLSERRFVNRFGWLDTWHAANQTITDTSLYTLPIMRNPTPQFDRQVPLLGYEFQFSVQTLGDFDRPGASMVVMPRYHLIGQWDTVAPGERWFMFASDPHDPQGHLRMYYDSLLVYGEPGHTRHPDFPASPGAWRPELEHNLWHSLANTRAKVNNVERGTASFTRAIELGSHHQEHLGTPTFIRIPQYLRTWHGSQQTVGRTGAGVDGITLESSPVWDVWGTFGAGYHRQQTAWQNSHRWHGRHSLPRTTVVISQSNLPSGHVEGRTADQFIGVAFVFRTDSGNGLWDLSTFTNTGAVPGYPIPDYVRPWDETFPPRVPGLPEPPDPDSPRLRHPWNRFPWSWVRRPSTWNVNPPDGLPPSPPNWSTDSPGTPMIVFDYSSPAQSDSVTIGTH